MKHTLIITLLFGLFATNALALGRNQAGINAGFNTGGFTLGGDYEYLIKRTYGYGAFARFFQKDDGRGADGLFIFGANTRLHHVIENFDLSVAPGLSVINVSGAGTRKDVTSVGPSFSIAVVYSISASVSLGLENSRYWIWFDEDNRGIKTDDTSLRLVANF